MSPVRGGEEGGRDEERRGREGGGRGEGGEKAEKRRDYSVAAVFCLPSCRGCQAVM